MSVFRQRYTCSVRSRRQYSIGSGSVQCYRSLRYQLTSMLHLHAFRWQWRLMSVRTHHHETTASDLKALISEVSARYELGCDWSHQIANRGSLAAKAPEFTIGVVALSLPAETPLDGSEALRTYSRRIRLRHIPQGYAHSPSLSCMQATFVPAHHSRYFFLAEKWQYPIDLR